MKVSVIIPHRNRQARLGLCLWSVFCSIKNSGQGHEYEVVVSDNGSKGDLPKTCGFVPDKTRVVTIFDRSEMPIFNKPKLLNLGIEASTGDTLVFLDADAIVGPRWAASFMQLEDDRTITRLCYRVRYLPESIVDDISGLNDDDRESAMATYWNHYDNMPLSREFYGYPFRCRKQRSEPVFGNSQFAIRKEMIGGLRYDEEYVGRGYEDLSFIRDIWYLHGSSYRGVMVTSGAESMFHVRNDPIQPGWYSSISYSRNVRRFMKTSDRAKEEELSQTVGQKRKGGCVE